MRNPAYVGGGDTPTFSQTDGVLVETIDIGLAGVTDMEILEGGRQAIVAGFLFDEADPDVPELGVLLGYEDLEGLGFFDA